MSEINVLSRTQKIIVNPTSKSVSVVNSGPQGPAGPGVGALAARVDDLEAEDIVLAADISALQATDVTHTADISALEATDATQTSDIAALESLWSLNGVIHSTGPVVHHAGPVFTNHDNKHWYPKAFEGNATYVPSGVTKNSVAYWSFADSSTQWIKWLWQPGDAWEEYVIRFGVILPAFIGNNTSRWRYSEDRFRVNANSAGGGTVTDMPVEVASVTVPAIEAAGGGNFYGDIAVDVAWTDPLQVISSTIERVHDHAADLQSGALGIYIATATRTDPV